MGIEWAIAHAPYGSDEMLKLLRMGWEPFAVIFHPDYRQGLAYFRSQVILERGEKASERDSH